MVKKKQYRNKIRGNTIKKYTGVYIWKQFGLSLMRNSNKGPGLPGRSWALQREPLRGPWVVLRPSPTQWGSRCRFPASHCCVRIHRAWGPLLPEGGALLCPLGLPSPRCAGTQQVHSRRPGGRGEGDSPLWGDVWGQERGGRWTGGAWGFGTKDRHWASAGVGAGSEFKAQDRCGGVLLPGSYHMPLPCAPGHPGEKASSGRNH